MKDILIYQDIDLKIKRIENEIASSEVRKNATEMQNHLRALQDKLAKIESQAEAINAKHEKISGLVVEAEKKIAQIDQKTENVKGQDAEALIEVVKTLQNSLQQLDKEASNISRSAEQITREIESVMKNAKTAKKNLLFYRDEYDKLRASKEAELQDLKAKLLAQEKFLDKKLLAKYQSKQTGRLTKVFVPLENGRCGGCKMEIAATGLAKLEQNGYMECENCGRIIYIDKK